MIRRASTFSRGAWTERTCRGVLHAQFLDIFQNNPLPKVGAFEVLGQRVDLNRIKVDSFVTGAMSDHLTPWKACYRTTQLLGGESTLRALGSLGR